MKRPIAEHLMSSLPETTSAKEFFIIVKKRYHLTDNAEVGYLMNELTSSRYNITKSVRDYIMKMMHIQTKLKTHEIPIPDEVPCT